MVLLIKKIVYFFIFALIHVPCIYGINHASREFLNTKVIISDPAHFLLGIEKAEDFLYMGSYKLHGHLLPQGRLFNSLKVAADKKELSDKIIIILENNLTVEEFKVGSQAIRSGDNLRKYKDLNVHLIYGNSRFHASHLKVLTTKKYAFVGTTNFDKEFIEGDTLTRDFSLLLQDQKLLDELKRVINQHIQFKQPTMLS
ncbi:MAG: hypothetical protein FJX71_02380 [Alphaproteobacteria bacterium]|nr:hypothetical protein [Alphaproteobacteria bacterium]